MLASDFIVHVGRPGQPGPACLEVTAGFALLLLLGDGLVGLLCFYLLLGALARHFGEGRLARGFVNHFLVSLCALFLVGGGGCVAFAVLFDVFSPGERNLSLVVLGVVCLLLVAVLATWLLILLTRLHQLIPVPGEPDPRRDFPLPGRWN